MKRGGSPPQGAPVRDRTRAALLLALTLALCSGAATTRADGIPDSERASEVATRPAAPPAEQLADPPPRTETRPSAAPANKMPDPRARLPKGDSAVEYWDLTTELDSGHHLFVRFAITNEGPGDQLGFATGELVSPEGTITHFRNGRQKSRWTLSRDGLRLDIGKSHLDLHGPRYRLEVAKSYVKIDLSFGPRAGMSVPAGVAPEGYTVDLLALASPTSGTIWLESMSKGLKVQGQTAAVHSVVRKSETKQIRRRIELFSQQGNAALYVADFTTPSGKGSRWLRAVAGSSGPEQSDHLISETAFELQLSGNLSPRGKENTKKKSKKYWVPGRVGLSGTPVNGEVNLTGALAESDPLSDLPQPLRFLAGRNSSPRRVWSKANFTVTLQPGSGPTPLQFQNRGVAAINFTNPLTRR